MACLLKPRIDGSSATIPAVVYAMASRPAAMAGQGNTVSQTGASLCIEGRCYFPLASVYMTQMFGPLHGILRHLPCRFELYPVANNAVRKPLVLGDKLDIRTARLPTMVKTFLKACLLWAKSLPMSSEACFSTRFVQKRKVVVALSRMGR
jgi:hypothetical protein